MITSTLPCLHTLNTCHYDLLMIVYVLSSLFLDVEYILPVAKPRSEA